MSPGRLLRLAAACARGIARCSPAASAASADPASDYDTGLALGTQAYQYGVPLLDTERIFKSSTSVNVCDHVAGHGPVNQFCSIRNLANATQHTINAPNNDTPYSLAWLDLSKQPQVLHAPPIKNRFWEFELVDPWTNNFYNITSAHRKMGPGELQRHPRRRLGGRRPALQGQAAARRQAGDVALRPRLDRRPHLPARPKRPERLRRIQDAYSITPLSKFGTRYKPRRPGRSSARRGGDDPRHAARRGPARVLRRAGRRRCGGFPRPRRTGRCSTAQGRRASARD